MWARPQTVGPRLQAVRVPLRLGAELSSASGHHTWPQIGSAVPYCKRRAATPRAIPTCTRGDILISRAGSIGFADDLIDVEPAVFASYHISSFVHPNLALAAISYFLSESTIGAVRRPPHGSPGKCQHQEACRVELPIRSTRRAGPDRRCHRGAVLPTRRWDGGA